MKYRLQKAIVLLYNWKSLILHYKAEAAQLEAGDVSKSDYKKLEELKNDLTGIE